MPYLITSNTTDVGEGINTTGINSPSAYNNMLSSTINIPANSEIAVESVKITRNGNIQLSSANNQFGIYIGEDLNASNLDLAQGTGFPVNTFIRGNGTDETTNPVDLAERIKYGLYAGLGQHPNFMPVAEDGIKVELKNGSGEFTGFKYSFSQNLTTTTASHIPPVAGQGGWVASEVNNVNAVISASGTNGVIIKKSLNTLVAGECSVIGQKYPLNLAGGVFAVNYISGTNGSAGDDWEVGLTRATVNDAQAIGGTHGQPEFYEHDTDDLTFFDFSVADIGDGKLRCFDSSFNSCQTLFPGEPFNKRQIF